MKLSARLVFFVAPSVIACATLSARADAQETPHVETTESVEVPSFPTVHPVARVGLMTGAGAVSGFACGLFGGTTAMVVGWHYGFDEGLNAFGPGAFVGAAVGTSVGTMTSGRALDGNGKVWATLVGQAVGLIPITAAYLMLPASQRATPEFTVLTLSVPALTAAIGYELSSDRSAREAKYRSQVTVSGSIMPTADGLSGGLTLSF